MKLNLRQATLDDAPFLTDVVIQATLAQGRFSADVDLKTYRAGYEAWTRETVMGQIPNCTLSVIEQGGLPIGRLRVVRDAEGITVGGIQILPDYQSNGVGSHILETLKAEAIAQGVPLLGSVEKDNPHALRLYKRLGCVIVGEDEEEYHIAYRPYRIEIEQGDRDER